MTAFSSSNARWYAAQCLAHREVGAAAQLRNQDFAVFLPQRQKTVRHARKLETRFVPFFPGYLFVRLDLARDRWRSVNGTFGVARLVMNGDQPAAVPHGVVESLQQAGDADGIIDWQPSLKAGDPLRILTGPFADLICEMDRMDPAGRVRVLLNIMGARVSATLPRASVTQAASIV